MRQCPKNQVGTHCHILLLIVPARLEQLETAGAARGANLIEGYPKIPLSLHLDAQGARPVQKS
jgi:hypothetical protein